MDGEGLATGVRCVHDLRAVGRPRDIAVHHARLVRKVALALAVAIDEPDVESLVATAIAQERELLSIGRPPRPHRALLRVRQLIDPRAIERRAVDLERPRAVPGERGLTPIGREVHAAPDVVDIRHTRELLDRKAAIPIADRARSDDRWRRLDVRLGVRDRRGRTRAASRGPILGEALGAVRALYRGGWPPFNRGGWPPFNRGGLPPRPLALSTGPHTCSTYRPAGAFHKLARRRRDDERFRTHCGFAWGRDLSRDDGIVRHELVLETSFVCAIPRRLQEDAELFRRLR